MEKQGGTTPPAEGDHPPSRGTSSLDFDPPGWSRGDGEEGAKSRGGGGVRLGRRRGSGWGGGGSPAGEVVVANGEKKQEEVGAGGGGGGEYGEEEGARAGWRW